MLWCLSFFNFTTRLIFSPILPLIEYEFIVTHAQANSIFTFQSIGYAATMILSGFYSGRIGFKRSIVFSFAVLGCVCLCIPCVKSFSGFYIIVFFIGFSSGIFLPAVMPLIREHFAGEILGKTISMYDSAGAISIFSVPLIALLLLNYFRWRGIFSILGVALLIIAILFFLNGEELKVNQPHTTIFKRRLNTKKQGRK